VACHELGLYFLVDPGPSFDPAGQGLTFERNEEGRRLVFAWHPVEALRSVRLYPTFLRDALVELPQHTEQIVHRDKSYASTRL
jgi:hypothetical protein